MDAVSTPARPVDVAADRILQAIERRPAAAFAVFLLVHVLLWTILPPFYRKTDIQQEPRQRRMLPVAQLPVAPLGDAFDGIELQERRHVH